MNLFKRVEKTALDIERLALDYISQVYGLTADELQAAGDLGAALVAQRFERAELVKYLQDMAQAVKESDEDRLAQERYVQHVHAIWAAVGLTPELIRQANYAVMMSVNPADVKTPDDLTLLDIRIAREAARLMEAAPDPAPEPTQPAPAVAAAPVAQAAELLKEPVPQATPAPQVAAPNEHAEPPAPVSEPPRAARAGKPKPATPAPAARSHGARQWIGDGWAYEDGTVELVSGEKVNMIS